MLKKLLTPPGDHPQKAKPPSYEKTSAKVLISAECRRAMEEKEKLKHKEKERKKQEREQERERKKQERENEKDRNRNGRNKKLRRPRKRLLGHFNKQQCVQGHSHFMCFPCRFHFLYLLLSSQEMNLFTSREGLKRDMISLLSPRTSSGCRRNTLVSDYLHL